MKHKVLVAVCCLFPLALLLAAVSTDDNPVSGRVARSAAASPGASTRSSLPSYAPDQEIAPLRAEADARLARGDREGAKVIESQIHQIIYDRQPQQPVELTVTTVPEPRSGMDAVPDVTIYDGLVNSFATDYEADGTMWTAAGLPDSTINVWKSTDHGTSWTYIAGATVTPKALYGRLGMAVGTGDSNFIHVMLIHPNNNGDVYELRWNHDGTGVHMFPVWVGPDTIIDISMCRDNTSPYYLYAVANEHLDVAGEQNGYVLRSAGFGKDWALTDSFCNVMQPSIQAGAGGWIYLAVLPQVPEGKGQLNLLWNKSFGAPHQWDERNPKPDTFAVAEAVMNPAFTLPESLAVTWTAYHHDGQATSFDVLALHSTDGCQTWVGPTNVAASADQEVWPDLKNYRSTGNRYVNLSYTLYDLSTDGRQLYRTWSDADNPGLWRGHVVMSDSQPWRQHELKPLLVYSPGSSWSGAGCVFFHYSQSKLVWSAPVPGPGVDPDSLYFKASSGTALMAAAKNANPSPVNRTPMTFQSGQSVPCMDPAGTYVYEVYGRNLRRFKTDDGAHIDIALTDSVGHVCGADGGYIYAPAGNKVYKFTLAGSLVNATTVNITCDDFSSAVVNDTVWISPDRYAEVFRGYAASRFDGGSISEDALWAVGPGTNGTGNIAFDGTDYYVPWIGSQSITFKRFGLDRTLYDSGQVTINPRSVMCRPTPPTGVADATRPAVLATVAVEPNPLRSGFATLRFALPQTAPLRMAVYDVAGRSVLSRTLPAAKQGTASLDLRSVSNGVYLVRLDAGGYLATQKLVVQR